MGRHGGGRARRARFSAIGTVIALVLLVAGAVVLGAWWWQLRKGTDPIDADPVGGYAVVVSSAPCTDAGAGNRTVVTIVGLEPITQTTLAACGYRQGQRLAVEYLAGHPETARLAGTSTGRDTGDLRKWLPIAILAAGVLAVGATIMLMREQRRAHGGRSRSDGRVTVAELKAAAAAADRPTSSRGYATSTADPPAQSITRRTDRNRADPNRADPNRADPNRAGSADRCHRRRDSGPADQRRRGVDRIDGTERGRAAPAAGSRRPDRPGHRRHPDPA